MSGETPDDELAALREARRAAEAEKARQAKADQRREQANGDARDDQTSHPEPAPNGSAFDITLADLQHEKIEPIRWIVPDYIPEGLTVFAGRPKIGKSWLILGVALGVARGTEALGKFLNAGDVLYCGLEDGKRRMQDRVKKLLGPAITKWPVTFTFRQRLDPLDAGGQDQIEQWLIDHPNRRMVVIDTLGRVRGMKNAREEPYQYDYRLIAGLQELATRYQVAIVVVHHVRKSDAEDVLDTISGTTGLAGAADNIMVLGKHTKGVRLYLRGRDTEEQDKLVEFDPETALWEVAGEWDEVDPSTGASGLRKVVLDLLSGSPHPVTPTELRNRITVTHPGLQSGANSGVNAIRQMLWRLQKADPPLVRKSDALKGAYEIIGKIP